MTDRRFSLIQWMLLWLRQLRVMTVKELRQLTRDRALLLYIIYIFTLDIIIAAGATNTDLNHARLLVNDNDYSASSREIVYRLQPPYFNRIGVITHPAQGLDLLDQGDAIALINIPERFAETVARGDSAATVQLLIDSSKANLGYLTASYSAQIIAAFGREWTGTQLAQNYGVNSQSLPRIENQQRIWHNPVLNETWFSTIAQLLTMVTVACVLLPAAALVREKERGTVEQLLVSPLTPLQVMFSKVLAMILVTLIGTAIAVCAVMQPLFAVPIKGSLPLFFALTALYAFTMAGLGLLAATFARNTAQVGMLVLLIVVPINMLSGIRTPLESMPSWLQSVITISPLRHFVDITYGILLRGAGLEALWDSTLAMGLIGGVLFALGLWRFRRQFG